MTIEELLALLPEEKREDAKKALETHGAVDSDKFKAFIETDEGKKTLQPVLDSEASRAVEAHKKSKLAAVAEAVEKRADELVKERFPEATPEQKEMAKMKEDFEKQKRELIIEKQKNRAKNAITEMKVPPFLADHFHGMTDTETDEAVKSLQALVDWKDEAVKAKDDEWLAKSGKPGGGDGNGAGDKMKRVEFEALPADKKIELSKSGIQLTD